MSLRDRVIELAKKALPRGIRNGVVRVQRRLHLQWPPAGHVRFGDFRRLTPISPVFAFDRGRPIDRYYIEDFLEKHAVDIRGRVLELGDDTYTRRFGGRQVDQADVLSVVDDAKATIVADLTDADHVASETFDCVIFTQSLQMIYDMRSALRSLHRILKQGGVLLLTSHGTSKVGRHLDRDHWSEYWHITSQAAHDLMAETFPGADVEVAHYGNVLTAMCALHGLAAEELTKVELDHVDRDFQVIVTVRAVKRGVVT